jgi:hypothetical protein
MDYVVGYGRESFGTQNIGVKILVAVNHRLTENDEKMLWQKGDEIAEALIAETIRLDPKTDEVRFSQRAQIIACFEAPVFVEEIPNGYCSLSCCAHLPWFVVTTKVGRVKIGWRKRVLQIDWSDSAVSKTADDLFPYEDVTKSGRMIPTCGRPHMCPRKPCGCCPPHTGSCCVDAFKEWVTSGLENRSAHTGRFPGELDALAGYPRRTKVIEGLARLRGKNLACWCKPTDVCHADYLLTIANVE